MENQQKFEWNPNFFESINTTELDAFLSGWEPQKPFWDKQSGLYDTQFQLVGVPVSISQPQESGSGLKFQNSNFDLNPHFHEDRSNSNATQVSNLSSTSASCSAASDHYHNYESSSIQGSLASNTTNLTPVFQPEHSDKNRALLVRSVLIFTSHCFKGSLSAD